jgi:hypothetical protein
MTNVPQSDMWTVPWKLETPSEGGRILAKNARSTIVYEPNRSPYNENERKVARLFLNSREMLALLKSAADVIAADNPYSPTVVLIDELVKKIEGS